MLGMALAGLGLARWRNCAQTKHMWQLAARPINQSAAGFANLPHKGLRLASTRGVGSSLLPLSAACFFCCLLFLLLPFSHFYVTGRRGFRSRELRGPWARAT